MLPPLPSGRVPGGRRAYPTGTLISGTVLLLALGATTPDARAEDAPDVASMPSYAGLPRWVSDQLVVKWTPEMAAAIRTIGLATREQSSAVTGIEAIDSILPPGAVLRIEPVIPKIVDRSRGDEATQAIAVLSGWYLVHIDLHVVSLNGAINAYSSHPLVMDSEVVHICHPTGAPNDPSFAAQWALNQNADHDIDALEAYGIWPGGPAVTVAVLDWGVRYYHKDLGGANASPATPQLTDGNIWLNLAEKLGVPGTDDDANGYTDDWVGWDFVASDTPENPCSPGEDCFTPDNDPSDFLGHGTHCSGIVAALNNNGVGVSSAAGGWGSGFNMGTGNGVKVMCLRIGYVGTVSADGADSAVVEALTYAADNGARIASCSFGWGPGNGYSQMLSDAIDYFNASGGLIFKAAENNNQNVPDYMSSRPDVYSVASTNSQDKKSSFSNYGPWVAISAPGSGVYSTWHDHTNPDADAYTALSGTSMATPMTAAVAASVWSFHPAWNRQQVWDALRFTCDNIDAENPTYVGQLGAGRVNEWKALLGVPGDLNGDGLVNGADLGIMLGAWGTSGPIGDLNGDGTVDGGDLGILLGHWD